MKIATSALVVAVALTGLGGCYAKLTPEMRGLSHTPQEFKNARKVVSNQNVRALNDEIARMWLVDNPSHLTPWPVVDTSGMPR